MSGRRQGDKVARTYSGFVYYNDAAVDAIFDLADEIERAVAEVPSDDVAARKFLSFYSRVIDALRSSTGRGNMEKIDPKAKPLAAPAGSVEEAIEKLIVSDRMTMMVAMEFGYLACEAGLNIQAARAKFLAVMK